MRASVELWRKCIDITDLLKVVQAGAAAGGEGMTGSAARVDGAVLAGIQLRTAGDIMQVLNCPEMCLKCGTGFIFRLLKSIQMPCQCHPISRNTTT